MMEYFLWSVEEEKACPVLVEAWEFHVTVRKYSRSARSSRLPWDPRALTVDWGPRPVPGIKVKKEKGHLSQSWRILRIVELSVEYI